MWCDDSTEALFLNVSWAVGNKVRSKCAIISYKICFYVPAYETSWDCADVTTVPFEPEIFINVALKILNTVKTQSCTLI